MSEPIPPGVLGFLYDIWTSFIAFMFMFNPELILHGVTSWIKAIMIFVMALVGMSAFECFAQGWGLIKNKWYDIPFFLATAFTLLNPGAVARLFHVSGNAKYYFFFLGLFFYSIALMIQRYRLALRSPRQLG